MAVEVRAVVAWLKRHEEVTGAQPVPYNLAVEMVRRRLVDWIEAHEKDQPTKTNLA